MKKCSSIFIIILCIISTSSTSEAQFKLKAKDKFTQAQQKANTVSPDAMLYAITSTAALDTTGKDISWLYYYYTATLDTGIIVTTTFLGALTATLGPTLNGALVRILTNNFVDSDIALLAAENAGGRQYRYTHPGTTLFATVYKLPGLPDTTRPIWTIIYTDSSSTRIFFVDGLTGQIITLGIKQISEEIPKQFLLYQNFPNPFNPETKIKINIAERTRIKLNVYNTTGELMETIVNDNLPPGIFEAKFDGSKYASGIYYYTLITDKYSETKKMVLLK